MSDYDDRLKSEAEHFANVNFVDYLSLMMPDKPKPKTGLGLWLGLIDARNELIFRRKHDGV